MTVGQLADVLSKIKPSVPVTLQMSSKAQQANARMIADGQFPLVGVSVQRDVERIPADGYVQVRTVESTERLVLAITD